MIEGKLNPCPHCGDSKLFFVDIVNTHITQGPTREAAVGCMVCGFKVSSPDLFYSIVGARDQAREYWNGISSRYSEMDITVDF